MFRENGIAKIRLNRSKTALNAKETPQTKHGDKGRNSAAFLLLF